MTATERWKLAEALAAIFILLFSFGGLLGIMFAQGKPQKITIESHVSPENDVAKAENTERSGSDSVFKYNNEGKKSDNLTKSREESVIDFEESSGPNLNYSYMRKPISNGSMKDSQKFIFWALILADLILAAIYCGIFGKLALSLYKKWRGDNYVLYIENVPA